MFLSFTINNLGKQIIDVDLYEMWNDYVWMRKFIKIKNKVCSVNKTSKYVWKLCIHFCDRAIDAYTFKLLCHKLLHTLISTQINMYISFAEVENMVPKIKISKILFYKYI